MEINFYFEVQSGTIRIMNKTASIIKFIIQSVVIGLAIGFLIVYFNPQILKKSISENTLKNQDAPYSYANAVSKIAPSVAGCGVWSRWKGRLGCSGHICTSKVRDMEV
jgi:hypothetical protein